jgi:hypothetical protein
MRQHKEQQQQQSHSQQADDAYMQVSAQWYLPVETAHKHKCAACKQPHKQQGDDGTSNPQHLRGC